MGVFDFLKKEKAESSDTGMELPPIPSMEMEFPELPNEEVPPLPEESLPPLPSEMPGAVPARPKEEKLTAPEIELPMPPSEQAPEPKKIEPRIPKMPTLPEKPEPPTIGLTPDSLRQEEPEMHQIPEQFEFPEYPSQEKPEFPEIPEHPSTEIVPDKIPPLEGIPEAPPFMPSAQPTRPMQVQPSAKKEPEMEELMHYFPPEEPVTPQRKSIKGPVYVRTDTIRAVLDNIEQVRSKFKEEDDIVFRLKDIKGLQDQKYESFRDYLEDIQRKLLFIDRALFER